MSDFIGSYAFTFHYSYSYCKSHHAEEFLSKLKNADEYIILMRGDYNLTIAIRFGEPDHNALPISFSFLAGRTANAKKGKFHKFQISKSHRGNFFLNSS